MALVSKREFAEMCGLPTKNLSVYIQRKKVKVKKKGGDEFIDTNDAVNASFLESRQANIESSAPVVVSKAKEVVTRATVAAAGVVNGGAGNDDDEEDGELPPIGVSERRLRHYQAEKTERDSKLAALKISKMQGEVVPTAPLIPIMKQHNKHLLDQCNRTLEEMLTFLRHRYRISPEDTAWMRGEAKKWINAALVKAIESTEKSIDIIVADYTETRGRGERK